MFDYPTPDAIAGYLLRRFADRDAAVDDIIASAAPASQEELLSVEQVDELSEEDVATLLRSRLAR
jgi:hypothetical protein